MNLQERIDNDLKDAMRAKDAQKLGVLRMLKSALKNVAIEKGGATATLDEAEATQVIRKQVKQRQDSIESFEGGGRLRRGPIIRRAGSRLAEHVVRRPEAHERCGVPGPRHVRMQAQRSGAERGDDRFRVRVRLDAERGVMSRGILLHAPPS